MSLRDYKLVDNGSVIYNDDWNAYEVVIGDQSYLVKAEEKQTEKPSPVIVKDHNGYTGTLIEYRGNRCIFKDSKGFEHNVLKKNTWEV